MAKVFVFHGLVRLTHEVSCYSEVVEVPKGMGMGGGLSINCATRLL